MKISIFKWNTFKPRFGASRLQSGFSLIELMISIALGLLIMTGVLALYSDLTKSNAELARMNRQVENGRLTLHILQQGLWHAGYWDTYVPVLPSVLPPTAIPNPCLAFSDWDAAYISRDLCKTIHFCCKFLKTQFNVEILGNFGEFFAKTKRYRHYYAISLLEDTTSLWLLW